MHIVWSGPSEANCTVSTICSVVRYRRSAAPRNSSSKKGSGPRIWPEPPASARFTWTIAASRRSAGIATSSSPSAYGEMTVRRFGFTAMHVGAEAGPGGEEGQPLGGRKEAQVEHALVDFHRLDRPGSGGQP